MKRRLALLGAAASLLACLFTGGCGANAQPTVSIAIQSPASAPTIDQGQTVNVAASVQVTNSSSPNSNVTWSLSGSGCAGAACGSLTSQTASSVTYNAPSSVPSNTTVTVTATSVADPSKAASINITVAAVAVTINNKVTELAAGTGTYFHANFGAAVQNDPMSGNGVSWSLTANGTPCSPACGTLSAITIGSLLYTPPATVPAAPDNTPILTATSVTDPAKSDTDAFTIFDGAMACGTEGNESELNGEYAIMLQGWYGTGAGTPLLYGASFGADGTGKVMYGQDQFNPFTNDSMSGAAIIPSASSYSVGADGRGCLTLTDSTETTHTLHFSLGGVSGGVASKGDVIFFNQQSATPERGSGILRLQDPTAFSLSALASNFALGVDGWGSSNGALKHFASVGSFALSNGTLSNPSLDENYGGQAISLGPEPFGFVLGSMTSISTGTGEATASLQLLGPKAGTATATVYVINSSELFLICNDLNGGGIGAVFSGVAVATPASFSSSSVAPNYIFGLTGSSSGSASAAIGLASFSGGLTGTVSGKMNQYGSGAATNQGLTGSYAFTQASGRLAVTGASSDSSSICYLTNPVDNISALCMSTDASASFGFLDAQPAATYSNSSLSGNFFFGSREPGDNTVPDLSGAASISAGNLTGTQDASAPSGLSLGSALNVPLSINADGTGSAGANTVAATNGTVLYLINESPGAPAAVQVFEQ